jgi:hypothetical protein
VSDFDVIDDRILPDSRGEIAKPADFGSTAFLSAEPVSYAEAVIRQKLSIIAGGFHAAF